MDTTLYEFDPLEPRDPRSVGGYPLRARIGAGGMGRVYLSFTPGGRAVAVKLIRPEFAEDPEFRERFAREVAIAQRVNGIYIAQLIDAGTEGGGKGGAEAGTPWLASAYVPGPALGEVVAATGPVPPGTVLALAGRIAESLAAVHATGMVHRDLKPGNILLDETGPKVIDFGIVRAVAPTATGRSSHRTFIGSPPFMAPEQIRGQKISPATDVFALGATAYYLATGRSAFQADFADGVLYRVLHDEPDYEACPPQIRELIRACLRKDPGERPDTQRIIEGCNAAGADRAPLLPAGVREMIDARTRALAVLARRTGVEEETAPESRQAVAAPQVPPQRSPLGAPPAGPRAAPQDMRQVPPQGRAPAGEAGFGPESAAAPVSALRGGAVGGRDPPAAAAGPTGDSGAADRAGDATRAAAPRPGRGIGLRGHGRRRGDRGRVAAPGAVEQPEHPGRRGNRHRDPAERPDGTDRPGLLSRRPDVIRAGVVRRGVRGRRALARAGAAERRRCGPRLGPGERRLGLEREPVQLHDRLQRRPVQPHRGAHRDHHPRGVDRLGHARPHPVPRPGRKPGRELPVDHRRR
ncbi:MAG TPA: protein kinase [Actinospica sp.]|nr:protein kinase [Actinospica sp.]